MQIYNINTADKQRKIIGFSVGGVLLVFVVMFMIIVVIIVTCIALNSELPIPTHRYRHNDILTGRRCVQIKLSNAA